VSLLRPTTQDLEITAQALETLRRRDVASWAAERFVDLVRPRARFRGIEMIGFCERCGLLAPASEGWCFTEVGTEAIAAAGASSWGPLAAVILRSGSYDDELTRLAEMAIIAGGKLRCPAARVERVAPTAAALLMWDAAYREGDGLAVPTDLLNELLNASTMEHALTLPSWVEDNARVGWRAELYSLRLERARLGSDKVLHVSRDVGDAYGYDIETSAGGARRIEVKGSRAKRVAFFLTANELAAARKHPAEFELQFWGEISLGLDPAEEFAVLLERGYPIVMTNVADAFDGPGWAFECRAWHVTPSNGEDPPA
jgi:hypothetical protein